MSRHLAVQLDSCLYLVEVERLRLGRGGGALAKVMVASKAVGSDGKNMVYIW